MTNLGSNFLERLGQQASYGFGSALRRNPGGGGASEATDAPAFRMWGETYGISATNGAQGDFAGDRLDSTGRIYVDGEPCYLMSLVKSGPPPKRGHKKH